MALRSPALALAGPDIGHLDERASRAVLGTRAQRGTHAVNSCATGKVVAGGIEDAVLLQCLLELKLHQRKHRIQSLD